MKHRFKRRYRRSSSRAYKRVSHRKNSSILGNLTPIAGAMAYGAGREWISNKLTPLTSKIPLGAYADEVGLIAAAMLTKKFVGGKVPLIKDVANAAILIESSRIGAKLASGMGVTSTTTTSSSQAVVYG